ncbi:SH3L3 protein, partial [Amia calva]|nr:SH3L3 protein [Amia calva]
MRILESKGIQFELIDISVGNAVREEMRTKAGKPTAVPPQIFNGDDYCGVSLSLSVSVSGSISKLAPSPSLPLQDRPSIQSFHYKQLLYLCDLITG